MPRIISHPIMLVQVNHGFICPNKNFFKTVQTSLDVFRQSLIWPPCSCRKPSVCIFTKESLDCRLWQSSRVLTKKRVCIYCTYLLLNVLYTGSVYGFSGLFGVTKLVGVFLLFKNMPDNLIWPLIKFWCLSDGLFWFVSLMMFSFNSIGISLELTKLTVPKYRLYSTSDILTSFFSW